MAGQIDYNDPRYAQAAAEILRRHDNGEPEANITSAVRDFLIVTGLVMPDEIVEENPPAQGSRRAVDLAALDTFIEFKRRIGTAGGFNPNPEYVQQLDDYRITESGERQIMRQTIAAMKRLHAEGRNHIWAYYTRNLVRPVALSRRKVNVIVGNPPWLIYRNTANTLRTELERQSKDLYGIWVGGRHANHQDISSLFFARCVDLYLKDGGVIGMVMPHSALQTGQHSKWRTGAWQTKSVGRGRNRTAGRVLSVDFDHKMAWDLEGLEPNNFFPVPASVVFARRNGEDGKATPLTGKVERWLGEPGEDSDRRKRVAIVDTSTASISPYGHFSRNGATIYPRPLFFVEETTNPTIVQAGQTVTVNPRRGSQDKEPWKSLDLYAISEQTVEAAHVFDVHLGETIVPYATLDPLRTVLPLRRGDYEIPSGKKGVGGIRLGGLSQRMRDRWQTVSNLWETNRTAATKMNLLGQLDYYGKLSSQLEWRHEPGDRQIRIVYGGWGAPTAALLHEDDAIVDYKLFWVTCRDAQEAFYLLAIINSDALYEMVTPLMSKGQFGARDLQKQLWKLPIAEFNSEESLHATVSRAGRVASEGAAEQLAQLRQRRGRVTVTIARREIRKWLRESTEGKAVEEAVEKLLKTEQSPTNSPSGSD